MLKTSGLRFIFSGILNTALTYTIYICLLQIINYQASYAIAFVIGIFFSYVMGRIFVFKVHQGYRSALMLPLVYLFQYLIGAGVVWIWVDMWKQSVVLAPAVSIVITLPTTYFLSKLVFVGKI